MIASLNSAIALEAREDEMARPGAFPPWKEKLLQRHKASSRKLLVIGIVLILVIVIVIVIVLVLVIAIVINIVINLVMVIMRFIEDHVRLSVMIHHSSCFMERLCQEKDARC